MMKKSEIRAIVSRRRESEYLLRRRVARKADFLRYAEAEMKLEKLRVLRDKQVKRKRRSGDQLMQGQSATRKKKGGNIGDGSIIKNIHFIFTRATRKWKSDVSLFLAHAEYAKKTKSFRMLGRIYANALQVHPKNSALWIEAASHEFFGYLDANDGTYGGSIKNARVLMQRGIRANPNCKELYLQYFSLEWHYAQKLRGREQILQLSNSTNAKEVNSNRNNNNNDDDDDDEQSPSSNLYKGAVPLVIYKMAIQKIPNEVSFRLQFLSLCDLFPQTRDVKEFIMTSIEEDFAHLPDAWIARAAYIETEYSSADNTNESNSSLNTSVGFFNVSSHVAEKGENENTIVTSDVQESTEKGQNVYTILEQATQNISTPEMYMKCIEFLQDRSCIVNTDEQTYFLKRLFHKAKASNNASPALISKWATFLISINDLMQAELILRQGTIAKYKNNMESKKDETQFDSSLLWLQYADLIHKMDITGLLPLVKRENEKNNQEDSTPSPPSSALKVLQMASNFVPMYDPSHKTILIALFRHLLINYASSKKYKEEIPSLFTRILLLSRKNDDTSEYDPIPNLCLNYLQFACASSSSSSSNDHDSISAGRKVYETVLFHSNYLSGTGGENANRAYNFEKDLQLFFNAVISLEKMAMAMAMAIDGDDNSKTFVVNKLHYLNGVPKTKRVKLEHATSSSIVRSKKDLMTTSEHKHRLKKIYECIHQFYKNTNDNVNQHHFRQRQYDDLGIS